jgi:hypothetical protein
MLEQQDRGERSLILVPVHPDKLDNLAQLALPPAIRFVAKAVALIRPQFRSAMLASKVYEAGRVRFLRTAGPRAPGSIKGSSRAWVAVTAASAARRFSSASPHPFSARRRHPCASVQIIGAETEFGISRKRATRSTNGGRAPRRHALSNRERDSGQAAVDRRYRASGHSGLLKL